RSIAPTSAMMAPDSFDAHLNFCSRYMEIAAHPTRNPHRSQLSSGEIKESIMYFPLYEPDYNPKRKRYLIFHAIHTANRKDPRIRNPAVFCKVMEPSGLEPLTFALPAQRSPS